MIVYGEKEILLRKQHVIIIVLLGIVSVFAYFNPQKEEEIPTRVLLDNVYGKVVFDHSVHASISSLHCQDCHHEILNNEEAVSALACNVCHGSVLTYEELAVRTAEVKENMPADERNATVVISGQTVKKPLPVASYHDTNIVTNYAACLTCHHLEFTPKDWGHDMHVEAFGLDCYSCHHADTDIEPEPMNCNTCHFEGAEISLKYAVHTKCMDCHQDKFEIGMQGCADCHETINTKKVFQETGTMELNPTYMSCATCHEGVEANSLVQNTMSAYHDLCIGCHEQMGKGPYKDDQCAQCHVGK